MRGSVRVGRLLACLAVGLLSRSALGEYRHRVVLLEHESDDEDGREVTTRVRGELRAAGFEVVLLPTRDLDPRTAVESAGQELHPASVLLVERPGAPDGKRRDAGAELWLADRLLKKTVVLRLKPDPDAQAGAAARIAVQAVELVKARLAELAVTRESEPAPPLAPRSSAAPVPSAPREARPNLTLGMGLFEGFAREQRALTPLARLGVALPRRFGLDVLALDARGSFAGLGRAARIHHDPGSATLRYTVVEADAVARFFPRRRLQPFVSLGAGLLLLDVQGDAPEPYLNGAFRTRSGLIATSAGVWLQPLRGVGVVLEGQLLNAWSKTVVRIVGEDAAEVAGPLLLLSGGLMLEL